MLLFVTIALGACYVVALACAFIAIHQRDSARRSLGIRNGVCEIIERCCDHWKRAATFARDRLTAAESDLHRVSGELATVTRERGAAWSHEANAHCRRIQAERALAIERDTLTTCIQQRDAVQRKLNGANSAVAAQIDLLDELRQSNHALAHENTLLAEERNDARAKLAMRAKKARGK